MTYTVQHSKEERDSFGSYRYHIFKADKLIANFWHDYRGDDNGIEFLNGTKVSSPCGSMISFLQG